MSNYDDYQAKIADIEAITNEEMKSPNVPVAVFVQEAEDLHKWCADDRETLSGAGLNWILVEDLSVRAGALREAESIWFKERFSRKDAQKEWNKKSLEAFDLRNQLIHDFYYAFRNHPVRKNRVTEIADGNFNTDIIQDLNDLYILGMLNTKLLEQINFDLTQLETAAIFADEMASLLSQATTNGFNNGSAKTIRDKAYVFLMQAVDEVRECGQYVFWRDEIRSKGYIKKII